MKKVVLAALFAAIVGTPTLAAGETYVIVKDVVGNCSAVFASGVDHFPGMKILGKTEYSSQAAAREAAKGLKVCEASARPF